MSVNRRKLVPVIIGDKTHMLSWSRAYLKQQKRVQNKLNKAIMRCEVADYIRRDENNQGENDAVSDTTEKLNCRKS